MQPCNPAVRDSRLGHANCPNFDTATTARRCYPRAGPSPGNDRDGLSTGHAGTEAVRMAACPGPMWRRSAISRGSRVMMPDATAPASSSCDIPVEKRCFHTPNGGRRERGRHATARGRGQSLVPGRRRSSVLPPARRPLGAGPGVEPAMKDHKLLHQIDAILHQNDGTHVEARD